MITQWMAGYPSENTEKGDKQSSVNSTNSRFLFNEPNMYQNMDIGVEICLDHYYMRLRKTVGMTVTNGASIDNYPIYKQFVTSAGMSLAA